MQVETRPVSVPKGWEVIDLSLSADGELGVLLSKAGRDSVIVVGETEVARVRPSSRRLRALAPTLWFVGSHESVAVASKGQVIETALPHEATCGWAAEADELYAVSDQQVHWYDGERWRAAELPSGGFVAGDGFGGLNVVVGCHGTHSTMARGRYLEWVQTGCGSWYLYGVNVEGPDRAYAIGGDGLWELEGSRWLEIAAKDRLDYHFTPFVGSYRGRAIHGRSADLPGRLEVTVASKPRTLELVTGRRRSALPGLERAWWLGDGRIAVWGGGALWTTPELPLDEPPDSERTELVPERYILLPTGCAIATSTVSKGELRRFLEASGQPMPSELTQTRARDEAPATWVSPELARAYATANGLRLPTNEEWSSAIELLRSRELPLSGVWEWTSTHVLDGFAVRGGRYRSSRDPPRWENESWESIAAPDVGFRCVRDARSR